jgi:hypothetical protein
VRRSGIRDTADNNRYPVQRHFLDQFFARMAPFGTAWTSTLIPSYFESDSRNTPQEEQMRIFFPRLGQYLVSVRIDFNNLTRTELFFVLIYELA